MQVSACWTEAVSLEDTLYILEKWSGILLKRLNDRRIGDALYGAIKERNFSTVVDFEINYNEIHNTADLLNLRQVLAFYQKLEALELPGVDKRANATRKWEEAEKSCASTNNLLRSVSHGSVCLLPRDTLVLHKARGILANLLGRAPSLASLKPRFGPGATASIKKMQASIPMKLGETPSCSLELLSSGLLSESLQFSAHWLNCHSGPEYCKSDDDPWVYTTVDVSIETGKLEFVPKNAKTYRSIDKQPTVNTLWQSAIGDYMSCRLKRRGVDLSDQAANRAAAAKGSIDGNTATIDLSSASDTISYELVKALLPDEWFSLLRAFRCGSTLLPNGEVRRLEKFCAMGNGFTFPLESAIFYALTKASLPVSLEDREVLVYGDDIICSAYAVDEVYRTLNTFGFEVNEKKSFCTGPFRESCGGDYFKGIDIRPYYQKTLVSGETLFTAYNFFFANYDDEMCNAIKRYIPTPLRLYGPSGYGDGHLHSLRWPYGVPNERSWGGVFFDTYAHLGSWITSPYYGDYVSPLYLVYIRGEEILYGNVSYRTLFTDFKPDGRPKWSIPEPDDGVRYEKKRIYTFNKPSSD